MNVEELRGRSHVILAIDEEEPRRYWDVLESVGSSIHAVKLGWMAILVMGSDGVRSLIKRHDDKYFIMDAKMADVNFINEKVARKIADLGFNGLIMHGFIGPSNAPAVPIDLFVLIGMTQGPTLYDAAIDEAMEYAASMKRKGIVAPGNKPNIIRAARKLFPGDVIISPGIGAQGGSIGCAVSSGADFGIVGRSIYESSDPAAVVRELEREAAEARC